MRDVRSRPSDPSLDLPVALGAVGSRKNAMCLATCHRYPLMAPVVGVRNLCASGNQIDSGPTARHTMFIWVDITDAAEWGSVIPLPALPYKSVRGTNNSFMWLVLSRVFYS